MSYVPPLYGTRYMCTEQYIYLVFFLSDCLISSVTSFVSTLSASFSSFLFLLKSALLQFCFIISLYLTHYISSSRSSFPSMLLGSLVSFFSTLCKQFHNNQQPNHSERDNVAVSCCRLPESKQSRSPWR